MKPSTSLLIAAVFASGLLTATGFAADPQEKPKAEAAAPQFPAEQWKKMPPAPPLTPEMRQKMAEMHLKMAECLKSDKPMAECHDAMMKARHEVMGDKPCPDCPRDGAMKKNCKHKNCPRHGRGHGPKPEPKTEE